MWVILEVEYVKLHYKKIILLQHFFPSTFKNRCNRGACSNAFETAGIGNHITAFQHRRFINRCNRGPIVVVSKTASIGSPIAAFSNRHYRPKLPIFLFIFLFEKILSQCFKSVAIS